MTPLGQRDVRRLRRIRFDHGAIRRQRKRRPRNRLKSRRSWRERQCRRTGAKLQKQKDPRNSRGSFLFEESEDQTAGIKTDLLIAAGSPRTTKRTFRMYFL